MFQKRVLFFFFEKSEVGGIKIRMKQIIFTGKYVSFKANVKIAIGSFELATHFGNQGILVGTLQIWRIQWG